MLECLEDGSRSDCQVIRHFNANTLFLNKTIKPCGINSVFNKFVSFQQLHEIFNSGANFSANFDFLQSQNKSFSGLFTSGSLGKQVTKLRVSIFVDSSVWSNTKVSPDARCRLELNTFDRTRCGLETFIRVFGSDTGSNNMGINVVVPFFHEINLVSSVHVTSEEPANFRNIEQRNSHSNLELRGRHVDARNSFGDRMLHLKTRIQLKEEEIIGFGIV
mmetsp:Transcript_23252/g.49507  ORF Transcript_23252/g.49507 Transcript_23252/m.49507 type:complete len:218 (+) Transcript_23252:220-873(+)